MAKNIVICADGTGNTFENNASNVSRLVRSLDLGDKSKQIAFYDQGVGTEPTRAATDYAQVFPGETLKVLPEPKRSWWLPRRLARWLGFGFGYGLYENIKEMYEALVANYAEDDRIYLFGFSRGAFTVRALAGFVHRCGLLPREQFSKAYNCFYREQHYEGMKSQSQLNEFKKRVETFRNDNHARGCKVHFLGIWDTVKSYGFIYPQSLPHLRHNPSVLAVRHALALNERRSYYQPTSWGGIDHPLYEDVKPDKSKDVKEVWFAGSHSDVGGGYKQCESGLARAPFEWMLREARAKQLCLNSVEFEKVLNSFPTERVLHESLHRFWWVSECLPRFELENIPIPGQRVLKWGSTGRREPLDMTRGKTLYVHNSVPDVYAAMDIALPKDRSSQGGIAVKIVSDS